MLLDNVDDACVILIDACSGEIVTAGNIKNQANQISQSERRLVFLMADGTIESARWFLALLEAHHPVALIDPSIAWPLVSGLIDQYRPDLIIDPGRAKLTELMSSPQGNLGQLIETTVWRAFERGQEPHNDLAVLLTTSGSTGSPKFVRLSSANIRANAEQIVSALGITAEDRGVTALPPFYSFGMSVLTSHAMAGSSVLVTTAGVLEEQFWSDLVLHHVSFLPGVPATYSMLKRLEFDKRELPSLRALIQAGGRLAPELVTFFHQVMASRGGRFFVMYGQTEASPRISCLPSEHLPERLGSAGLALAGGDLTIRGQRGENLAPREIGEVIYRGPNVMMGYANSREHLALGATHGTVLSTGDNGYLDEGGFLYLTGRSKRICKLAGTRVSLDEIESIATSVANGDVEIAAVDNGDAGVAIFATDLEDSAMTVLRREIANQLRVPPKLISVTRVDAIPMLSSGKTDYAALNRSLGAGAQPK